MVFEAMRLDLVSECRWKTASRTEPGGLEWEMFRAPGDEKEPTMGGVAKALLLSRIRLSGNMDFIPLMTWKRVVSMDWWGQKHDRGRFKRVGTEEVKTI